MKPLLKFDCVVNSHSKSLISLFQIHDIALPPSIYAFQNAKGYTPLPDPKQSATIKDNIANNRDTGHSDIRDQ